MESKSEIAAKDAPKINFNFQIVFESHSKSYVNKIKEIEGGRILLLYDDFFVILNLKSKKQIGLIKVNFERENTRYYNTIFYDFIELKNRDLIIWSRKKILH